MDDFNRSPSISLPFWDPWVPSNRVAPNLLGPIGPPPPLPSTINPAILADIYSNEVGPMDENRRNTMNYTDTVLH